MKILNVELPDIDLMEFSVVEKWENAFEKLTDKMDSIPDNEKESQRIKTICVAVFELFNEIFGEGTDKLVFGDKVNMFDCTMAVAELKAEGDRIVGEKSQITRKLADKYSIGRLK